MTLSLKLFVLLRPHVCHTTLNITLDLKFLLLLAKNALEKPSKHGLVVNFVASNIVVVAKHLELEIIFEHGKSLDFFNHDLLFFQFI